MLSLPSLSLSQEQRSEMEWRAIRRARPSRVNNFSRLSPCLTYTLARFPDISLSQRFTPPFVNYRITFPRAIIPRLGSTERVCPSPKINDDQGRVYARH